MELSDLLNLYGTNNAGGNTGRQKFQKGRGGFRPGKPRNQPPAPPSHPQPSGTGDVNQQATVSLESPMTANAAPTPGELNWTTPPTTHATVPMFVSPSPGAAPVMVMTSVPLYRGGPRARKPRIAFRPPQQPQNAIYHCESCDKSFSQKKFLDKHLENHIKCPYEGCNFSAVKAVMKSHELIHIRSMFSKLETPEEIERYREERRKRYPTAENIQKKLEEAKKLGITEQETKTNQSKRRDRRERKPQTDNNDKMDVVEEQQKGGDKKRKRRPLCKYFRRGKCVRGENCTFSHEIQPQQKRRKPNIVVNKTESLLEKLLEKEENREHVIILQCLQYIVDNNFFSKDKPTILDKMPPKAVTPIIPSKEDVSAATSEPQNVDDNEESGEVEEEAESDDSSEELEEGEIKDSDSDDEDSNESPDAE